MKLGKSVLLEIVAAVQKGLTEGVDISDQLRSLEMEPFDGAIETTQFVGGRRDPDVDGE